MNTQCLPSTTDCGTRGDRLLAGHDTPQWGGTRRGRPEPTSREQAMVSAVLILAVRPGGAAAAAWMCVLWQLARVQGRRPERASLAGARAAQRALGRELVRLRTAVGFSQTELARKAGYARSTLGESETGHRLGSRELWRKIDDALGAGGALVRRRDEIAAMYATASADAVQAGRRAPGGRGLSGSVTGGEADPVVAVRACPGCGLPLLVRLELHQARVPGPDASTGTLRRRSPCGAGCWGLGGPLRTASPAGVPEPGYRSPVARRSSAARSPRRGTRRELTPRDRPAWRTRAPMPDLAAAHSRHPVRQAIVQKNSGVRSASQRAWTRRLCRPGPACLGNRRGRWHRCLRAPARYGHWPVPGGLQAR